MGKKTNGPTSAASSRLSPGVAVGVGEGVVLVKDKVKVGVGVGAGPDVAVGGWAALLVVVDGVGLGLEPSQPMKIAGTSIRKMGIHLRNITSPHK